MLTNQSTADFLAYVADASGYPEASDREWIGTYWSEVCSPPVHTAHSYADFEAAVLKGRKLRNAGEPVFRFAEENSEWPLFHLLTVNSNDPELCDWFKAAQVGDECPEFSGLVLVS